MNVARDMSARHGAAQGDGKVALRMTVLISYVGVLSNCEAALPKFASLVQFYSWRTVTFTLH